jgi:hypothetical protein
MEVDRILRNSITASSQLLGSIEADLTDVRRLMQTNARDLDDRLLLSHATRRENIDLKVRSAATYIIDGICGIVILISEICCVIDIV